MVGFFMKRDISELIERLESNEPFEHEAAQGSEVEGMGSEGISDIWIRSVK